MPATNYTPIQLYRSTTSGNLPLAANLSPGELALNIADTDMTMYFENASGVVKRFFNNPAELKYPTADGTSGQFLTTNGAGVLSFGSVAAGALTNNTRQAVTSSATTTINLNSGNVIDLTMAANITTLSFTNVPASGTPILIQIVVKNASNGTAYTITWPNSVYWSGQYAATTTATVQTAPTLATGANGVTVIALLTTDGGTKWRGWVEGTIPGGALSALYSWGTGEQGGLGQGTLVYLSSPVQVGSLTNWASISNNARATLSIKTDGTLWAWGQNTAGRLGLNSVANVSSPTQVGASTDWSFAVMGTQHALAIKTSGSLWAIGGNNYFGGLGLNNRIYRSSPNQIGALTTWVTAAASGDNSAAIKTDGTLWVWGNNYNGTLGLDSGIFTDRRSSPVQLGALTNWSKVILSGSSCAAIKTDNTLWSWGLNSNGQLGQNDTVSKSSPVQVGALTNWSSIGMGNFCAAVKTDGTLWTWGQNGGGRLGQNDTVDRSSPVQVGALTDWSSVPITAQSNFCPAIKTNGTLWSWGLNSFGQLGQNNTTARSSPVQVGALTNWTAVSAGNDACVAIITTTVNPA